MAEVVNNGGAANGAGNGGVDPSSPYFQHYNENPGAILVPDLLTGENYHVWSRAMFMALKAKNKEVFIDGSLEKPARNNPNFVAWDKCNTLVMSWITRSMDRSIVRCVLWMNTALDIWKDLKKRYYQGDVFRISELEEEMFMLKQGDSSITEYYSHLQELWQELDNFMPIPGCSCEMKCSCDLVPTIKSYRERNYVIRFFERPERAILCC